MNRWAFSILAAMLLVAPSLRAADFHVDPAEGTAGGDGSEQSPFASLQQLLDDGLIESEQWDSLPADEATGLVPRNPGAPIKGGDTIWLADGDYGALVLQGYYNIEFITIAAGAWPPTRSGTSWGASPQAIRCSITSPMCAAKPRIRWRPLSGGTGSSPLSWTCWGISRIGR